jgi:DNA-binding beta-propeller fold protein YncE
VFIPAAAQGQQYSFVTKWGSEGTGFGKFRQPLDIAIDSDNNLYVIDTTSVSNQIQKFAPDGTFITS